MIFVGWCRGICACAHNSPFSLYSRQLNIQNSRLCQLLLSTLCRSCCGTGRVSIQRIGYQHPNRSDSEQERGSEGGREREDKEERERAAVDLPAGSNAAAWGFCLNPPPPYVSSASGPTRRCATSIPSLASPSSPACVPGALGSACPSVSPSVRAMLGRAFSRRSFSAERCDCRCAARRASERR